MQRKILQFDHHNIVCQMEIYRTYTFYGDYEITQDSLPIFKNLQMSVEIHDLHPEYKTKWDEKKYNPENLIDKYIMKEIKHSNMDNFDVTFIEPELQAFIDKYKNDYVKVMNGKIPKCMFTADAKRWDLKVATPIIAIYQNKDAGYRVINTMSNTVETVKAYEIAFLLRFIENDTLLYGNKKDIADIKDTISKELER